MLGVFWASLGGTWGLLGTLGASLGCPRAALGRSRRPCDSSKFTKRYACACFSVYNRRSKHGLSGSLVRPPGVPGRPQSIPGDLMWFPWVLLVVVWASLGCPQGLLWRFWLSSGRPGAVPGRSQRLCDSSKFTRRYACAGFSVLSSVT
jgi:hypothetical protein